MQAQPAANAIRWSHFGKAEEVGYDNTWAFQTLQVIVGQSEATGSLRQRLPPNSKLL